MPKKIIPDRLNLITAKSFCELLNFEVSIGSAGSDSADSTDNGEE